MIEFGRFSCSVIAIIATLFIIVTAWFGVASIRSVGIAVAVIAAAEIGYWLLKAIQQDQETQR